MHNLSPVTVAINEISRNKVDLAEAKSQNIAYKLMPLTYS